MRIQTSIGVVELKTKAQAKSQPNELEPANDASKAILDDLFRWVSISLEGDWVKVTLYDTGYGEPEYQLLPELRR